MSEAASDKASLELVQGAIRLVLHFKNPLTTDDVLASRTRHEGPSVVLLKSRKLVFHGGAPLCIIESKMIGPGGRMEGAASRVIAHGAVGWNQRLDDVVA